MSNAWDVSKNYSAPQHRVAAAAAKAYIGENTQHSADGDLCRDLQSWLRITSAPSDTHSLFRSDSAYARLVADVYSSGI